MFNSTDIYPLILSSSSISNHINKTKKEIDQIQRCMKEYEHMPVYKNMYISFLKSFEEDIETYTNELIQRTQRTYFEQEKIFRNELKHYSSKSLHQFILYEHENIYHILFLSLAKDELKNRDLDMLCNQFHLLL